MPRSVGTKNLPQPIEGTPLKPTNLSERASQEWDRLLGELATSGLKMTVAHRPVLAMAATIAADIASDWKEIQEEGAYQVNVKTHAIQAHPATKRLDALRRDYLKALAMLGLRPLVSGDQPGSETLADVLED